VPPARSGYARGVGPGTPAQEKARFVGRLPELAALRAGLARACAGHGGLVLYRDVEVDRRHPLTRLLDEPGREGVGERIALQGLSREEVVDLVRLTAGRDVPEGLAGAVFEGTEGNPFYVTQVVRLLAAEGRLAAPARDRLASQSGVLPIPQTVREAVARRLDRLSPAWPATSAGQTTWPGPRSATPASS
jgi:predicted ATPase